jgi:hypothetical protein
MGIICVGNLRENKSVKYCLIGLSLMMIYNFRVTTKNKIGKPRS